MASTVEGGDGTMWWEREEGIAHMRQPPARWSEAHGTEDYILAR
jgi:hypothetical protein